jgi:hypothetical protein
MSKLAEAKQILAERGRTIDGSLENSSGCLCPIGALCVAHTGESGETQYPGQYPGVNPYHPYTDEHMADLLALSKAAFYRGDMAPFSPTGYQPEIDDYSWVYRYNDTPVHTDEQVLSLFDLAMELV